MKIGLLDNWSSPLEGGEDRDRPKREAVVSFERKKIVTNGNVRTVWADTSLHLLHY